MGTRGIDTDKVKRALAAASKRAKVQAGEPGALDPAVPPHGGTHDTDIEIADDVVKLVDVNSPDTPDLETRAYEQGTEDDGTVGPPYDGESSVDGIPEIPDTMAATRANRGSTELGGPIGGDPQPEAEDPNAIKAAKGDDAGQPQKSKGGGGPVVQLPDTMEDELSVAPKDPHASASLTTADVADLRRIMAEKPDSNVEKAVNALLWLDHNASHPKHGEVRAGLDRWQPSREQAVEAQARFGFAYLHTNAAAENPAQTKKILAWLKGYIDSKKMRIAADFLRSDDAKENPELAKKIRAWYEATAVDQVRENKEDVGLEDITLYGPQNGSPDHRPGKEEDGFTEPKVVSLDDVPFKDPSRHPAEAGSETDKQTGSPAQDSNAVDGDSFSAKNDDRAKETHTPSAATRKAQAMGGPMGMGLSGEEEVNVPPVPGQPPIDPMAAPPVDPMAAPPVPGMPGELPELPPVLPEGPEGDPAGAMGPMPGGGAPGMPGMAAEPEQTLEEWLQQELMEPSHQGPAESAHVEMLSSFDEIGQVYPEDVVMALYGDDQENPHWNIDIKGRPVARIELSDQPNPEEVRSTFLSASYAESIAQAMAKVGPAEVLQAVKAKPYAAKVEIGDLAQKIRAKVESEYKEELAQKVGELRDRFLTAAKIALAGYNNNFFRGEDHQLKAAIWSELKRLGVRDAARVIEAAFEEGSVPFFESVLAKAEELMDMPDEARNTIAKAIPETNALVTADADDSGSLPEHETLASHLESGNLPFTNPASPVTASRDEVRAGLRQRVRLSTFRSS